jgi:hypothetical protein
LTLRLNGSTSGYTELDAPAVAGSNTLVLPTGNGASGQMLRTDGAGALTWADPASGSAPVSATATGRAGQIAYDGTYIYICVATNTWRRATHALSLIHI